MRKSVAVLVAVVLASCNRASAPPSFGVLTDSAKAALTRWCGGHELTYSDGSSTEQILRCGTVETDREALVQIDKPTKSIVELFARAEENDLEQLEREILRPGLSEDEQRGLDGLYAFMRSGKHPRGETKHWNGARGSELSLELMVHKSDAALDLELRPYFNEHLSPQAKSSITTYVAQWCEAHLGTVTTVPGDGTEDRSRCEDARGGELAQFTIDKRSGGVLDFEIFPLTLVDFDEFVAKAFSQLPPVQPTPDELRAFLQGDSKDEQTWPTGSSVRRVAAHGAVWELVADHHHR